MALFEWKDEYSVSVERFDREHQELFSLLNQLNEAMTRGQGRLLISEVLHELLAYTREHFAAEESAMRMVAFSGLASHTAEHRLLTEKAEQLAADYSKGKTSITIDVLYFLSDWLQHHILATDRKYKEALQEMGIR